MKKQGITLVTGGARSGKSSFGESILIKEKGKVLYIATAEGRDEEMRQRIIKHQQSRPQEWLTHEGYKNFQEEITLKLTNIDSIILDCVTIMTTNLILEDNINWDNIKQEEIDEIEKKVFQAFDNLINFVKVNQIRTVLITNEVGLGIVPIDPLTRIFRDIAGRVNQYLAGEADEVYFVTCGIPSKIK